MRGIIKRSATRINVANYCRMKYWLAYVDPNKQKPLRLSAYVRGSLLHGLVENFWGKLGKLEEIKYNKAGSITSKKKYFDAGSFAKYAQRKWQSIISADNSLRKKYEAEKDPIASKEIADNLIYWRDDSEKYVVKNNLPKVCVPLFNHIIDEGPPIASELPFDFMLGNIRLTGKIDEIRKRGENIVIRDYKSGKPWVGEMKLAFDPQLTMYNVGLCSICFSDRAFARKLGLEDRVVDRFMGNPIFINPDFKVEFFMLDALGIDKNSPKIHTIPEPIVKSERRDEHFYEVIKMIKGTDEDMRTGNVYPERGRKCDDCDRKISCAKKLEDAGKGDFIDKRGQTYFSFAIPSFARKEEIPEFKQKKIRFRKVKQA